MENKIKLCPYMTRTVKETIKEGLKVSDQQFMPCILDNCAAYNETCSCCVRTGMSVYKD